ncbi:MAG: DUF5050 domain-containing protein [Lachnospiraceae bacterium]|nr:DUF5050 domain-containing protein [Lachnospiraceae bacterium]
MNNKVKLGLILGGLALCMGFFAFLTALTRRIPSNPAGTLGNTAGNLYNSGLYCESGDKIFFANAYDNGALYVMNTDGSNIKKLHDGTTNFINAGGNYLYYMQTSAQKGGAGLGYVRGITGMYRIRKDGKRAAGLSRNCRGCIKLVDDHLYYQHYTKATGVSIHRMRTNKKDDMVVLDKNIAPAATYQGNIYCSGLEQNHNLYAVDMNTGETRVALQANLCFPTVEDGYVYYMDVSENYRLCRIDLTDPQAGAQVLTTDRIDAYNVYGSVIYYQRNSETAPALMRMNLDGSNPELIAEGNYSNINCTSSYTYFTLFGADVPVYRVPTFQGTNVDTFNEARDAALRNME